MKLRLARWRDALVDSFWFLPTCMALFAGLTAILVVSVDHAIGSTWARNASWVWSGGADGARGVLSVVAGSVMTVVSIVFSLTISALAQTSSHFGPRVLRNFTSDRAVQFTLGVFISTFVYCLLVLRTVRSVSESSFVPYLAINLGVALALASLAVLIFFIHHISQSIQAENLIADVGQDFQNSLNTLFPQNMGQKIEPEAVPDESHWLHAIAVDSVENGYLQRIDNDQIMRVATKYDLQIRLGKRPGEFIAKDGPLLEVVPPSHLDDKIKRELCNCFSLGRYRTPAQDIFYSLQQLVEIAAHAMSPGINEPYTCLTCIDWLGASLRGIISREMPSPYRHDENHKLRVIADTLDFAELAQAAFDPIRLYGATNPDVMAALLTIIKDIAPDLKRDSDREVLQHHVQLLGADASQIVNESDRNRVLAIQAETLRALRK